MDKEGTLLLQDYDATQWVGPVSGSSASTPVKNLPHGYSHGGDGRHLVSHEADLDLAAIGILPRILSDATHPVAYVVEAFRIRDVVHQDDPVRAAVVGLRDLVEPLLRERKMTWQDGDGIARGREERRGVNSSSSEKGGVA